MKVKFDIFNLNLNVETMYFELSVKVLVFKCKIARM